MSRRFIRTGGCIIAGMFAIACDDAPTSSAPADVSIVASLEQAAAQAAAAGNLASATLLTNGAVALSYGLQPSEILVSVKGETTRYNAVVVGTATELSPGDTAIQRSLIAWAMTGTRTIATLDVGTLGDVGSFSSEFEPASDPRSRAQGMWADLVRDSRWLATTGTAQLSIEATGHACHTARFADVRCTLASYRVFIDGLFRLEGASPDAGLPAVRIMTEARGVNGVLLSKNDPRMREPERRRHRDADRDPRRGDGR